MVNYWKDKQQKITKPASMTLCIKRYGMADDYKLRFRPEQYFELV